MTQYLTVIEVLFFHQVLIDRYGGSPGVRDMGALESALYRPKTGYYENIIEEAAALWESLTNNHPFVDGNKRVGFAVMEVFLKMNGFCLKASLNETWHFMNDLFENQAFEFSALALWLDKHTKEIIE